jgi:pseudouridine synthase, RluA family
VAQRIEIQTESHEHKKRLEDFLFDRFTGLSKMYLREVVKNQKCEVNGEFENIGYRLRTKDFVEIEIDPTRSSAMRPENVPIDIVFEDNEIIVVDKPSGMLVHPTHRDKNGTLLNALTFYLNKENLSPIRSRAGNGKETQNPISKMVRPGLVHRLDKETSGLIVIAKTAHAHRVLADHFKRKLVGKRYLALVDGVVFNEHGAITAPIGRFADKKYWGVKTDGKYAETRYWVRERYADSSLLELEPVTGRTNQLRIHCASIGYPIIGDVTRGGREFERLCLHAHKLSLWHPNGSRKMEFIAKPPREMMRRLSD